MNPNPFFPWRLKVATTALGLVPIAARLEQEGENLQPLSQGLIVALIARTVQLGKKALTVLDVAPSTALVDPVTIFY